MCFRLLVLGGKYYSWLIIIIASKFVLILLTTCWLSAQSRQQCAYFFMLSPVCASHKTTLIGNPIYLTTVGKIVYYFLLDVCVDDGRSACVLAVGVGDIVSCNRERQK